MNLRAKKWVSRYHASHKQSLQFKPFVAAALPNSKVLQRRFAQKARVSCGVR